MRLAATLMAFAFCALWLYYAATVLTSTMWGVSPFD